MALAPVTAALAATQDSPQHPERTVESPPDGLNETNVAAESFNREMELAAVSIRAYTLDRRAEAAARARQAADDLDHQMERLQQQTDRAWDRMSQAARSRSREQMADLRRRRTALAEWYGGMRHGSTAAWEEVRNGFVSSYRGLAGALRGARESLGRDERRDPPDSEADEKPRDERH